MGFKVIEDLAVADKLWEVGLLWFKLRHEETYTLDTTFRRTDMLDYNRPTVACHCDYAILVEE